MKCYLYILRPENATEPNECYIGTTKNINRRVSQHRYLLRNSYRKLYSYIRNHADAEWVFTTIEIEADNKTHLLQIENDFINQYNPILNQRRPYRSPDQRKQDRSDANKRHRLKKKQENLKYATY